jgi:hypothetical protein
MLEVIEEVARRLRSLVRITSDALEVDSFGLREIDGLSLVGGTGLPVTCWFTTARGLSQQNSTFVTVTKLGQPICPINLCIVIRHRFMAGL